MELDFDTIKALSSRTRIQILNETVSHESTPTDISNSIDRSKSTVASHLNKLESAGLLEKDQVEGRKRVVYKPTEKTKSIIKGRDKTVKFSVLSSITNAWIGIAFIFSHLDMSNSAKNSFQSDSGTQLGTMTADKGLEASTTAQNNLGNMSSPEEVLLLGGAFFMSIAFLSLVYGLMISRIRRLV